MHVARRVARRDGLPGEVAARVSGVEKRVVAQIPAAPRDEEIRRIPGLFRPLPLYAVERSAPGKRAG